MSQKVSQKGHTMSVIELSWTDKRIAPQPSKNRRWFFSIKAKFFHSPHNPYFSWCPFRHQCYLPPSAHRRSSWTMIPSNFREDCTGLLSSSLPTTLFANKQGIIDREAHVFHLRKFSLGMQVGKRVFPSQPMVQRFPNTWVHYLCEHDVFCWYHVL